MSASEDKKRLNRELQDIENEGIDWTSSLGAIRDVMSSFNNLSSNNNSNSNPNNNISAAGLDLNKFTSSISSVFDKINNSSVSNMFGGVTKSGIVADTAIAAVTKKQENDVSTIYNKSIALPSGSGDSSSSGSGVTNAITSLISSISSLNSALKDNSNKLVDNSKETARNTPLYTSNIKPTGEQNFAPTLTPPAPRSTISMPPAPSPGNGGLPAPYLPFATHNLPIIHQGASSAGGPNLPIIQSHIPSSNRGGLPVPYSLGGSLDLLATRSPLSLPGLNGLPVPYSPVGTPNLPIVYPGGLPAPLPKLPVPYSPTPPPVAIPTPPEFSPKQGSQQQAQKGFLGIVSPYGGSAIHGTFESLKGFFAGVELTGLSPNEFANVPQQMRAGAEYSRLAHGTGATAAYNRETYLGSINRGLQFTSEQGNLHSEAYRAASERASLDMFGSVSGMTQPQIAAQNIALAQREHRARAGIIGTAESSLHSLLEGYQHTDYRYSANTGFNVSGNTGISGVMRRAFSSVDTKGEIIQEAIESSRHYRRMSINRDNEQTAVSDFSRENQSAKERILQKMNEPGIMNALRSYDEKEGIAPTVSNRREAALSRAKRFKNEGEALLASARTRGMEYLNTWRAAEGMAPVTEEHFENAFSHMQEFKKARGDAARGDFDYRDPANVLRDQERGRRMVRQADIIAKRNINLSSAQLKGLRDFSPEAAKFADEYEAVQDMGRMQERLQGSRATPYEHLKSMKGKIQETGGQAIAMNMQNMQWALMLGFSGPVFQALSQIPNESSYRAVTPTYGAAANLFGLSGLSRQFESFPEQSSRQLSEMQTRTNTMSTLLGSDLSARQAVNKALDISKEQPIQFNEALEIVSAMSTFPGTRKATANPDFQNKMFESAQFLAMLAPEQGTGGALFAMREMLGGQYRSLQTRFNISPDLLAGFANTSVGRMKQMTGEELIGTTHEALTSLFGGPKILMKRGAQMDVQLNNIGDVLTSSIVRPIAMSKSSEINKSIRSIMDDTNKDGSKSWIEKNSPLGSLESILAPQQVKSIKEAALIDTMDNYGMKYRKGDTFETAISRVSPDKKEAFKDEYAQRTRSSAENMYGTGVGSIALIATSISTMLGNMFGSLKIDDMFGAVTGKVNTITKDRINTYQQQTKDIPDDGSEASNSKRSSAARDMVMGFISDIKKEVKSVGSSIGGSSFGNVISGVADLAREGSMAVLSPVANTIMTQTAKTALSLPSMMIGGMVDTATRGAYNNVANVFSSTSPQAAINPSNGMDAVFQGASSIANTAAWSSIMIAGSRPWAAAQRFLSFSTAGMAMDKFENKDFGGAFLSLGQTAAISIGPYAAGRVFERLKDPTPINSRLKTALNVGMTGAGSLSLLMAGYNGWDERQGFSSGSMPIMTASTAMAFAPYAAPAIAQGINRYTMDVASVKKWNEDVVKENAARPSGTPLIPREPAPTIKKHMQYTLQNNPIIPISIGTTIATAGITSGISNFKREETSESSKAKSAYNTAGWVQTVGTGLGVGGALASGASSVLGATALGTAMAVAAPALLVAGAAAIGGGVLYSYYADSEEQKFKDKGATDKVYQEIDRIKRNNFGDTRTQRIDAISSHFDKTVKSFGLDKYIAPEYIEEMRTAHREEIGSQEDSRKSIYEKTVNNIFARSSTDEKTNTAVAIRRLFKSGQLDDTKPEEMGRKIAEKELSIVTALTPLSEDLAGMIQNPDSYFERDDRGQIKGKSTRRQQISSEKSKALEEKISTVLKNQTNLSDSEIAAVSKQFLEETTFAMRASVAGRESTSAMFNQNMAPMIASQIREQFNYNESMIPGLPNAIKGADTTEEFRDKTIQAYQQANQFENSALSKYEPTLTAVALGGGDLGLFNAMGAAQKDVTMSLLKRGMLSPDVLTDPQKINQMMTQVYMHGSEQDIKDFQQLLPLNINKIIKDQTRHAQVSNENVADAKDGHPVTFKQNDQGVWYDATETESHMSPAEIKKKQERADDFSEKLKAGQIDTSVGTSGLISEIQNVYRHGTNEQRELLKEKIPVDIREMAGRTFGMAGYGDRTSASSTPTTEQTEAQQPSGGQIPPPKKPKEDTTSGSDATSASGTTQETTTDVKRPPSTTDSTQSPGKEIPGGVSISIGGGNNITIGGGNTISSEKGEKTDTAAGSSNTQPSGSNKPPKPDPIAPDPVSVAANEKEKSIGRKIAEPVVDALAAIGPSAANAGEMLKRKEVSFRDASSKTETNNTHSKEISGKQDITKSSENIASAAFTAENVVNGKLAQYLQSSQTNTGSSGDNKQSETAGLAESIAAAVITAIQQTMNNNSTNNSSQNTTNNNTQEQHQESQAERMISQGNKMVREYEQQYDSAAAAYQESAAQDGNNPSSRNTINALAKVEELNRRRAQGDRLRQAGHALLSTNTEVTQQDIQETQNLLAAQYADDNRSPAQKREEIEQKARQKINKGLSLYEEGRNISRTTHTRDSATGDVRETTEEERAAGIRQQRQAQAQVTEGALELLSLDSIRLSDLPDSNHNTIPVLPEVQRLPVPEIHPGVSPLESEGTIRYRDGLAFRGTMTHDTEGRATPLSGRVYRTDEDGQIQGEPLWAGSFTDQGPIDPGWRSRRNSSSSEDTISLSGYQTGNPYSVVQQMFSKGQENNGVDITKTNKYRKKINDHLEFQGQLDDQYNPEEGASGTWLLDSRPIYAGLNVNGRPSPSPIYRAVVESDVNGRSASTFINEEINRASQIRNTTEDTNNTPPATIENAEAMQAQEDIMRREGLTPQIQAGILRTQAQNKRSRNIFSEEERLLNTRQADRIEMAASVIDTNNINITPEEVRAQQENNAYIKDPSISDVDKERGAIALIQKGQDNIAEGQHEQGTALIRQGAAQLIAINNENPTNIVTFGSRMRAAMQPQNENQRERINNSINAYMGALSPEQQRRARESATTAATASERTNNVRADVIVDPRTPEGSFMRFSNMTSSDTTNNATPRRENNNDTSENNSRQGASTMSNRDIASLIANGVYTGYGSITEALQGSRREARQPSSIKPPRGAEVDTVSYSEFLDISRNNEGSSALEGLSDGQKEKFYKKQEKADLINKTNEQSGSSIRASAVIDTETGKAGLQYFDITDSGPKISQKQFNSEVAKNAKAIPEYDERTPEQHEASDNTMAEVRKFNAQSEKEGSSMRALQTYDASTGQFGVEYRNVSPEAPKAPEPGSSRQNAESVSSSEFETIKTEMEAAVKGAANLPGDKQQALVENYAKAQAVNEANEGTSSGLRASVEIGENGESKLHYYDINTKSAEQAQASAPVPDDMFNQKGAINATVPGSGFTGDSSFLSASGDIKDITQSLGLMPSNATNLQGASMGSPIDVGALSTNASYVPSIPPVSDMAAGFGGVASISPETISSVVSGSASPSGEGGSMSVASQNVMAQVVNIFGA